MSAPRLFPLLGGLPRAAIVLFLAATMITAGIGSRPVLFGETSLASDDQRTDSPPCEEPQEDSSEDEENAAEKHAAVVGAAFSIEPPVACRAAHPDARGPAAHATALGIAPIRGPPAVA